jgi:uncharacterized OsmC-like protein
MKINNVDVDKLKKVEEEVRADLSKAKKVNKIVGDWNSGEGSQFSAVVNFENGKVTLESDQPGFLGGGGTVPGPMVYCLFGSASCYAATFATMAALEGVELKSFRLVAEAAVDFSKVLGLSDNPIAEGVKFMLEVESDASVEKLQELEALATERCPAVYCLTNPIPLETELKKL